MTVRTRARIRPSAALAALATAAITLTVSGCSVIGGEESRSSADGETVVVLTHSSFELPEELVTQFEESTGNTLKITKVGDSGTLSAELALSADRPRGDAVFGIDNTFASRVLDAGALDEHGVALPSGAEKYALAEGAESLAPVGAASVCMNVDSVWFEKEGLEPPTTLDDLTDPKYRDLTVLPGASTSSPGMAFLLTTIAAKGEKWPQYWQELLDNGTKIVDGWSDAYYTDFSGAAEKGKRPIVLSYDSSPAFTVAEDGTSSTTAALLDTCFRQVEYSGVLSNAKNPEGARAFVEFLLSEDVQSILPEAMYAFPVTDTVTLPEDWAKLAVQPEQPWDVTPAEISENREAWLREWTDVITR